MFITDPASFDLDPFRKEKDAVTFYILTSLLHKHAYLGITQFSLQRARQHYVGISNAVAATARSVQSGLPRTLFLARRYHLRVYHYIANNHPSSFMFTPILHIHCLDALNFEMLAIKFLGPLALNETHRNVRNLPSHPYGSSAPRKKCRQGSRHRSRSSSSRDHVCTHGKMFYPILFRVDRTHVHFHRLHNLLSLHIGSLITVHVTPGRPLSSFKLVSATFGQSRVINHPGLSNLQQLLKSCGKTVNSPFSFMIIPRRSLTLHQAVMIFIDQIDGSFRNVHLPAFYSQLYRSFWFNLFRTISSRQSQVDARSRLVLRVRNFIKFYCHKFYSLTTRDLNCGLHSSISIDYHPLLHLPAISALQKSMLTCLVPPSATRFALAGSFTTIKSPDPLSNYVFNQSRFLSSFDDDIIPNCHPACGRGDDPHVSHAIVLPWQMSQQDRLILRNLGRPTFPKINKVHASVTLSFILLLHSIQKLFWLPFAIFPVSVSVLPGGSLVAISSPNLTSNLSISRFSYALHFIAISGSSPDFLTVSKRLLILLKFNFIIPPPASPPIFDSTTVLLWIFQFNLFSLSCPSSMSSHWLSSLFSTVSTKSSHSDYSYVHDTELLLQRWAGQVFIPVDHNHRQPARACPVKFHNIISTSFLHDPVHFLVLPRGTSESEIALQIQSKLSTHWRHRCKKPDLNPTLPRVKVMIKQDGVRVRILCDYSQVPHKQLLKKAAPAVFALLQLAPLKSFTLFRMPSIVSDVKQFTAKAKVMGLKISYMSADIKNFFSEIRKTPLLEKFDFVVNLYFRQHGTYFISVPKYDCYKHLPPRPFKSSDSRYIFFDLRQLRDIIVFSIDNAYFALGVHIIKQLIGLAMGDNFSPPLAILYVAVDEHRSRLPRILVHPVEVLILLKRYVDDFLGLIATKSKHELRYARLVHFVVNELYEPNQPSKLLKIVQTFDNKFLDSDYIISPCKSSIKLVYHNKNKDVGFDFFQDIGRFQSFQDPGPLLLKLNAVLAVLVRIYDATSLESDLPPIVQQLILELSLLDYPKSFFTQAFIMANRARPSPFWVSLL